jgi:hypothetical protein
MRPALCIVLSVALGVVPWAGCATASAGRRTHVPFLHKGGRFPALQVTVNDGTTYNLALAEVGYDLVRGTLADGRRIEIPLSTLRGITEVASDEMTPNPRLPKGATFSRLGVELNDGRVYHLKAARVDDDSVLGAQHDGTVVSIPLTMIEAAWATERMPSKPHPLKAPLLILLSIGAAGQLFDLFLGWQFAP